MQTFISEKQQEIVKVLETINNDYNSIIYHSINDLEQLKKGSILIGDNESIDFETGRLEDIEQIKHEELLPTLRRNKSLFLHLWSLYNSIEEELYK